MKINIGSSVTLNVFRKFFSLKKGLFVTFLNISFYFLLWIFNPGNKVIVASFIFLIIIFYLKFRNIKQSILLTYFTSIVIATGKSYLIELIPSKMYIGSIFPLGHISEITVTPSLVLTVIMLILIIRDLLLKNLSSFKARSYDYIFFVFNFWIIFSDIVGSNRPEISLIYTLTSTTLASTQLLIIYIFLRSYIRDANEFVSLFLSVIFAQVFFESIISFQQLLAGSPIYKNLEAQVNVITFGAAQDELQYRFRPIGTFRHANLFGLWLSFWLSVIFVNLYNKRSSTILIFTLFILGLIALIVTLSRSSWLGFMLSTLLSLYLLEKVKKIKTPKVIIKHSLSLSFIFLFLFVVFILPRAGKSLSTFKEGGGYFRYAQVYEAFGIILENPLFGVGSAMSVPEGLRRNPQGFFSLNPQTIHNWYLITTVEHGMPAIILFILFIIFSFRKHIILIYTSKFSGRLDFNRLGLVAGVLSLLIVGIFQPYIGYTLIVITSAILGLKSYETG